MGEATGSFLNYNTVSCYRAAPGFFNPCWCEKDGVSKVRPLVFALNFPPENAYTLGSLAKRIIASVRRFITRKGVGTGRQLHNQSALSIASWAQHHIIPSEKLSL